MHHVQLNIGNQRMLWLQKVTGETDPVKAVASGLSLLQKRYQAAPATANPEANPETSLGKAASVEQSLAIAKVMKAEARKNRQKLQYPASLGLSEDEIWGV
jgi:hypothetical protein